MIERMTVVLWSPRLQCLVALLVLLSASTQAVFSEDANEDDPGATTCHASDTWAVEENLLGGMDYIVPLKLGNITPYRRELMLRLRENCQKHNLKPSGSLLSVQFGVARNGSVLDAYVIESSGSRMEESLSLLCVKQCKFPPLPDWNKCDQLWFMFDLGKILTEKSKSSYVVEPRPAAAKGSKEFKTIYLQRDCVER